MLLLVAVTFGRRHDTQPNDTKLNDAHHKVSWASYYFIFMTSAIMLGGLIKLSVIMFIASFWMLFTLSVIMMSVTFVAMLCH
jgi:hypothetical protein